MLSGLKWPAIATIVVVLIAALAGGAWFVRDYTQTKAQNRELVARVRQADDVSAILGTALAKFRSNARDWREAYEELANVQDNNTCRSPAVDSALSILRAKRAR